MSKIVVNAAPAGTRNFKPLVWNKIQITKSLDEICHSLTLELPVSQRTNIAVHDTVEVRFYNKYITHNNGNLRVATVLIDEITDTTDNGRKYITVLGRSPARDIIDSAWTGKAGGSDLLTVAKSIAGQFDIIVDHLPRGQNNTETVSSFEWDCESPWTKLLNAADNQGYVFTSNEAGNLYLTKSGRDAEQWHFILAEGANIKSVETTEAGAEQFHEYVVVSSGVQGSAIDGRCKNKRILTLNLSDFNLDQEKAKRRALIELYRRRKRTTKVTVSGWGLTDEQIKSFDSTEEKELFFNPNFLIPVYIPSVGIDGKMMISEVEYRAEPTAFDCTVSLVNPEVYMGKEGAAIAAKKTGKMSRLEEIAAKHNITPIQVKK
nr:MAG TPA: 43 kDa tail protein [Caudoviricetes sp.]